MKLGGRMLEEVRQKMVEREKMLSPYATQSKDAIRLHLEKEDIRPAFFRDVDRIIYSLSYTRYIDKTQVFCENTNANISRRMTHVQMVSKIARTIGRALSLNEDLIEAIALGHDIGHVPFGHVGEAILNEISIKVGEGYFNHNVQSVRTLLFLENGGRGVNLTMQVLDGILCHNGEFLKGAYFPKKKTKEEFLKEYQACYTDEKILQTLHPMTLEGCVVRFSDMIGYVGRDIEDAIRLGVLTKEELPKEIVSSVGKKNREIINTFVLDVIENSYGKEYIQLSDKMYTLLKQLKKFNYMHIYDKATSPKQREKYKEMFTFLFHTLLLHIEKNQKEEKIFTVFLNYKCDDYIKKTTGNRKVLDYIAGMTDAYFISEYTRLKKEKGGKACNAISHKKKGKTHLF